MRNVQYVILYLEILHVHQYIAHETEGEIRYTRE